MRDISLVSDLRHLSARVFAPAEPPDRARAVLFLHGLSSSQRGYAERAQVLVDAVGATCITLDLSGHGDSDGDFETVTPHDNLRDAITAYDRLSEEVGGGVPIGVCGASYGGYLASLLSAHRPVDRMLLRAPALFDDGLFEAPLSERASLGGSPRVDMLRGALERFEGEVMVLEGERDEVVTHDKVVTYLEALPHPTARVIPEAGHALTERAWQVAFLDAIREWFSAM